MKFSAVVLLAIMVVTYANASIIRVPQDQPKIQAAIDAATSGDSVIVSRGEYFENINFNGKNIVLASNFILSNDPADIELTIINGSQPANPDTASCVRFITNENSSAMLIGFTLTGGKGTNWTDEHGAGTYREGGGILITFSSPTIKYNRIVYNEAIDKTGLSSAGGGGLRVGDGNPLIEGNFIAYNKGRYGAGLVLNYTGAVVRNNIFYMNSGGEDFGGGGIWVYNNGPASKIIVNNTIVGNSSTNKGGGGIYLSSTSIILKNNIIYGNTGGLTPGIKVVLGSSATATYNLIQGGLSGTGNINADPQLMSNFSLGSTSPAIDAGDANAEYNDIEDPQSPGNALLPSHGTIRNDMGAFGGQHIIPYSQILNPVDEETGSVPGSFLLKQNYPNPFNPATSISYSIPNDGYVQLNIYNIAGEKIAELFSGNQQAGTYTATFSGSDFPSGIYFYELRYNDSRSVRKMILMK